MQLTLILTKTQNTDQYSRLCRQDLNATLLNALPVSFLAIYTEIFSK